MKKDIQNLARPDILALTPYSSARSQVQQEEGLVFLDANENPYETAHNRYPDPQPRALLKKLAALYQVPDNTILGVLGSDQGIDLLVRAFCRAGQDSILVCPPTFDCYEVYARVQGASVIKVPLEDETFQLNIDAILKAVQPHTKLVFLCSPNNPTGNSMKMEEMIQLSYFLQGKAIVVVDEAYIEFSEKDSMTSRLTELSNLVVLRTLSKYYGQAGIRFGAVVADPDIIDLLKRVIPPYPLPNPTIAMAEDALENLAERDLQKQRILSERRRMETALKPLVKKIYPSDTNFLLVKVANLEKLMQTTRDLGVIIRRRDPAIKGTVRITIGLPEHNDLVIKAFGENR